MNSKASYLRLRFRERLKRALKLYVALRDRGFASMDGKANLLLLVDELIGMERGLVQMGKECGYRMPPPTM